MTSRRGFTLLELTVVMAIIAIAAAVSAPHLSRQRGKEAGLNADLRTARAAALAAGTPVTRVIFVDERPVALTALPDGRVLGDSVLAIDPFSGAFRAP